MKSILQNDLEVFRYYMEECLSLYGIAAKYYQLKPGCKFTSAGELKGNYYDPIKARIMFDQVPKISTLKKLGWVTELDQASSLIHVAFDTPGIQVGCLYEIKDPLTPDRGKLFRITKLQTAIIYPSFVTCQIVPVLGTDPEATTDPYDGHKTVFLDHQEDDDEDIY